MTLPFFETGGMKSVAEQPDHYSHTGECWVCISNLVKETQQDVLRSWVLRSCTSRLLGSSAGAAFQPLILPLMMLPAVVEIIRADARLLLPRLPLQPPRRDQRRPLAGSCPAVLHRLRQARRRRAAKLSEGAYGDQPT